MDSSNRTTYSRPNTIFITVVTTIIAIVEPATTLVVGPNTAGVSIYLNLLLRVAIRKGERTENSFQGSIQLYTTHFRAADLRIFPATGVTIGSVVPAVFSVGLAAADQTKFAARVALARLGLARLGFASLGPVLLVVVLLAFAPLAPFPIAKTALCLFPSE